jgi:hypothetical protein
VGTLFKKKSVPIGCAYYVSQKIIVGTKYLKIG